MGDRRHEAFLAVFDSGSFSEGARRVFATQPTASRQVASLEKELGVTLFDRSGATVRPTEAGTVVAGYLRRIGALEQQMHRDLDAHRTSARRFVINCPDNMVSNDYETFRLVIKCARRLTGMHVCVEQTPTVAKTRELLRTGASDIAFGLIEPLTDGEGDLCGTVLLEVSHYILCPSSHHLAEKGRLEPCNLEGERVILPFDDQQNTFELKNELARANVQGVQFESTATTASMLALLELGGRVGFSTFPVENAPGITCIPLASTRHNHLGCVWLRASGSAHAARFAAEVADIYRRVHPDWGR